MILAAAAVLMTAVLAAGGDSAAQPGGADDPLVTLSYINEVFTGYVTELFQKDLDSRAAELETGLTDRVAALEAESQAAGEQAQRSTYQVVTLEDGATLSCQRGAELMLRVGAATVAAGDTPGLVDTSTTANLDDGEALVKNHMYMVTINGHGVRAQGTVKLVVRGDYTVS